jgi:hypothetical protein
MTYHVQFPGLGLSFTLNRVAFTLFGMPVYWYGILIASGLLLALLFAFISAMGSTGTASSSPRAWRWPSCSHSAMRDVSALIPTAWWM